MGYRDLLSRSQRSTTMDLIPVRGFIVYVMVHGTQYNSAQGWPCQLLVQVIGYIFVLDFTASVVSTKISSNLYIRTAMYGSVPGQNLACRYY